MADAMIEQQLEALRKLHMESGWSHLSEGDESLCKYIREIHALSGLALYNWAAKSLTKEQA